MNRATQVALSFMIGQMNGLGFCYDSKGQVYRDTWSVPAVLSYYEGCVEDWTDNFTEDYYQIWYMDKRSPCVDWKMVSDRLQEFRDDEFLDLIFA